MIALMVLYNSEIGMGMIGGMIKTESGYWYA